MPIEINELHIRVTVNQPGSGAENTPGAPPAEAGQKDGGDKEAIINHCIEEVLTILNNKKER